MEKRFFLALLLTGVVVVFTPALFPRAAVPPTTLRSDSLDRAAAPSSVREPLAAPGSSPAASTTRGARVDTARAIEAQVVRVHTSTSTYSFTTLGAAPIVVQADSYPALNGQGGPVALRHDHEALLRFRVVAAGDTIPLDQMVFTPTKDSASDGAEALTFSARSGSVSASILYQFARDNYLTAMNVAVSGIGDPAFLLVDLPSGFDTQEADSSGDMRLLAYAIKPLARSARGTAFASLDSGERKLEPGPLSWAAAKSKYFLVALLVPEGGKPFAEARLEGGVRTRKVATNGSATVVVPLENGKASFELYAGPQSW